MTLHHLRVFIKVAECGSVSAAARECHLAQPTVSQLIKELEDFYAARLFERLSKRLYITEEGRRLLSRAKEVAGAYERLEYDMSPDKRRDRLRIGSSVTVGMCLMPSLVKRFGAARPETEIYSYVNNTQTIERMLLGSELDVAVVEGRVRSKDLLSFHCRDDYVALFCSAAHPFAARESVMRGEYLTECARTGEGIRILRQDKWEALCSFIISQCNNIPRIKGIVERLCGLFGEPLETPWGVKHAFPDAGRVARLEEPELAPLHAGYRAPYIINAARAVASGEIDLEAAAAMDGDAARAYLKTLSGVGDKVANCAVLFGLHRLDAFPIDVWIRRALKEHMPPDFDPKSLGEYAGLAQQYMFFAERAVPADRARLRAGGKPEPAAR